MQFLVVFLAVSTLAVSADLIPKDLVQLRGILDKCKNEHPVDPEMVKLARAGEKIDAPEFFCFVGCTLEGMNLIQPDGKLNVNAAINKLPDVPSRERLVEAIKSCGNESGQDKCDSARRIVECMHQNGLSDILKEHSS